MKVDGKDLRPIWLDSDLNVVKIIDQRRLPHEFVIADLETVDDVITAITEMYVSCALDRRDGRIRSISCCLEFSG